MKKSVLIILVLIGGVVLYFMQLQPEISNTGKKMTGLPWQIEILPDGNSSIFGITLGRSTFSDVKRSTDSGEIAIMSVEQADASLEMYINRFQAGVLTGKLVLVARLPQEQLAEIRRRAIRSGGEHKFKLHPDDRLKAEFSVIESMTFIPLINLDEEVVRQRFGEPAEIIKRKTLTHMLYPEKGLDVIVDSEGKEVLQYISPRYFNRLTDPLR
ncbi:MAG: hypothetical protein GXP13_05225 [Gammaproteobacteria bacterium]|nr:hypothetical protein [Gammaproteobacteria bacterium]